MRNQAGGTNFVAEWFGHRVYPTVAHGPAPLADQTAGRCPFLSAVIRTDTPCVKTEASRGVCTVSSLSNGPRQDWLVCPHRAIDSLLLPLNADRLFGQAGDAAPLVVPGPVLEHAPVRAEIGAALAAGRPVVVYLQAKLGGEMSLSATDASPELSFDFTLVELRGTQALPEVGRYAILEVQTMDYHGSYRQATARLHNALDLHAADLHAQLEANPHWLSQGIEGPNLANVFKRTFYQTMMKFQLADQDPVCAGAVLAVPAAVWDSWAKHLGNPQPTTGPDGVRRLLAPPAHAPAGNSWVCVFDIDAASEASPNPIIVRELLATDARSLSYYALDRAAARAAAPRGPTSLLQRRITARLRRWWPDLSGP